MTKSLAPVKEIGYSQAVNYNWWLYEDESTPELQWPQSIAVYDAMRRTDAQCASVLKAVTLLVRCTPWRLDPNGARDEVVEFVAEDLGLPIVGRPVVPPRRTKDKFSWSEHLRLALLMLPFGHAMFEQVYRVDEDGQRAHLRKLALRPSKTIERIDVAPDGGLISIKQYWTKVDEEPRPIPVDRLVAYVNDREGGNWLGSSILRGVYKNWLLKDRLLRVQAQTIERNGMGVPLYKAAETETELATGLGMATSWRAGEAAGSAIPFGADLVLRGVEGTLPDAEPAIRYHDEQIARQMLAHFLNLGTQTGSWALGTTFADFFTLSVQTVAESMRDTATQHVVEDLVDVNWGTDEPAPKLVFDQIGSQQAATAAALKTLVDAGVIHPDQVLEESSRQQYGLPARDEASTFAAPPDVVGDGGPKAPASPEAKDPSVRPGSVAAAYDQPALDAPEPVQARGFNPDQLRDEGGEDGGQWIRNPAAAIKDVLKLAGKIDLDDDEHLLGSGKVDADFGGIRMALTGRHGQRILRLGIGTEGFGQRDSGSGIPAWSGSDDFSRINAERKALRDERERLEAEWNDASPERQAQIGVRIEEIDDQDTMELGFLGGSTAKLDEYSMDRLQTLIRPALEEAIAHDKAENAVYNEIDRLEAQQDKLRQQMMKLGPEHVWTDAEDAQWDALAARIEKLRESLSADGPIPDDFTKYFARGIIPGVEWGDVHYEVYIDDPALGPQVLLGVKPKGTPDDWGTALDWQGTFDVAEARKFLRLLAQMNAPPKP